MKTVYTLRLIPLLALAGLIGVGAVAHTAENQAETRSQLQQLKGEIDKLKESLKEFRDERSRVQGDLRKSELEISRSQQKIRDIQKLLQQQEQELQKLQAWAASPTDAM